jgi:TolA-binding protein
MKIMRFAYLLSMALLLNGSRDQAAESKKQGTDIVLENSGQGVETIAALTEDHATQETERQVTQKKLEARLTELGNRIKELRARVEKEGAKAKAQLNEFIKELDKKMAVAKQQIEKLKSASARAWEDAKSNATAALEDLENTYDRAVKQIKKST